MILNSRIYNPTPNHITDHVFDASSDVNTLVTVSCTKHQQKRPHWSQRRDYRKTDDRNIVSVLGQDEGYMVKYGLSQREFTRAQVIFYCLS